MDIDAFLKMLEPRVKDDPAVIQAYAIALVAKALDDWLQSCYSALEQIATNLGQSAE